MALEILAPAGGAEQLIAAVRCGADAVYLGTSEFNARRNAENFSTDELFGYVKYCRQRNVKVYAAVNIIVSDSEIPQLVDYAEKLAELNIDGVIVQDFAAARIFKEVVPEMPLHASTQMTVHNKAGVRLLEKYGFKRFVPARELSCKEIKALAEETDMQVEVFVHGALCMSVSGCCYISSMLGGRSGNRGLCAQSCRLNFKAGEREYALSLKDMSYIENIAELEKVGVCSLKIEGRMKRPEYVAACVTACKKAINGEMFDKELLKNVFSRSGFTNGYLNGKRNLSMFGFRTYEDVTAATNDVFASLKELYRKENGSVPIDARLEVFEDKTALTVTDGENTVTATGQGGEKPQKKPLTFENAEKNIAKTGGTAYYLNKFEFENPYSLFLPSSCLNLLRRTALEQLGDKINKPLYSEINDFSPAFIQKKHSFKGFILRFAAADMFFDGDYYKAVLPVDDLLSCGEDILKRSDKIVAEIPSLIFESDEDSFISKLEKLKALGIKTALADNIGQIEMLKERGFEIIGGFGLNIINSVALNEYHSMGLENCVISFEADVSKIKNIKTDAFITAVTYGRLPLMKYRNCPMKSINGCASCNGRGYIVDRKNIKFPVKCEQKKYTVMYNSVPLDVGDKDFSFVDYKMLYFTDEKRDECIRIYNCAENGLLSQTQHTNGLYYRELL